MPARHPPPSRKREPHPAERSVTTRPRSGGSARSRQRAGRVLVSIASSSVPHRGRTCPVFGTAQCTRWMPGTGPGVGETLEGGRRSEGLRERSPPAWPRPGPRTIAPMRHRRMPIEVESPEEAGYGTIECNLAESSVADVPLEALDVDLRGLVLRYGDHRGLLLPTSWWPPTGAACRRPTRCHSARTTSWPPSARQGRCSSWRRRCSIRTVSSAWPANRPDRPTRVTHRRPARQSAGPLHPSRGGTRKRR